MLAQVLLLVASLGVVSGVDAEQPEVDAPYWKPNYLTDQTLANSLTESKTILRYSELSVGEQFEDDKECVLNKNYHFFWQNSGQHDNYVGAYSRINKLLIKRLNSLNIEKNFLLVFDLLDELTRGAKLVTGSKDANFVEALELLASLSDIVGPRADFCDSKALNILRANDLATQSRARGQSTPKCRVDKIVKMLTLEHANSCKSVYLSKYEWFMRHYKSNDLPKPIKNLLADKPLSKVDFYTFPEFEIEPDFSALNHKILRSLTLMSIVDENHDEITLKGKKPADKMIVQRLIDDYLIKPCQIYINTFARELYEPAYFDFTWLARNLQLGNSKGLQMDPLGQTESQFFHGMLLNQRCKSLLKIQDKLIKLIVPIIPRKK